MIKAIVFGLWEVLGSKKFSVSKKLKENFDIQDDHFLENYEKSMQLKIWDNKEEMVKSFLTNFSIIDCEENVSFVVNLIDQGIDQGELFVGMKDFLEKLKEKYRLGIISNTNNFESRIIKKWEIQDLFDKKVFSWEINSLKPSKNNFDELCDSLKVLPDQCIYVDNESRCLEVAKSLGFNVIKFTDLNNLKRELVKFEMVRKTK